MLVVDDQRAFADAVALAIDSQLRLRCLGAAGSVEDALHRLGSECPDVLLLDVRLPGTDGLSAITEFKARCPEVRVLVLTADVSPTTFLGAVKAGADGFLPKDAPFTDIIDAVRSGDSLLVDPQVLKQLAGEGAPAADDADPPVLTDRELEVLRLLAEGLAVKQIAPKLGITVNTCRGHVRAILHKLDAHSQLAAVVTATRLGLLHEPGS
ncbi:MAG TPA: response regulator transcription factor [Acidimicrobiales bacterium]